MTQTQTSILGCTATYGVTEIRIEIRDEWVPQPFCPNFGPSPLTKCETLTGRISAQISVSIRVNWASLVDKFFRLLPFGAGVRVCPGEVLAKNRLFLFFASFLQSFTFKVQNVERQTNRQILVNVYRDLSTNHPPYKICAEYRK